MAPSTESNPFGCACTNADMPCIASSADPVIASVERDLVWRRATFDGVKNSCADDWRHLRANALTGVNDDWTALSMHQLPIRALQV